MKISLFNYRSYAMNKEQIYETQVAPLMKQVFDICKENNIGFIANFSIPTEERPHLQSTTFMNDHESVLNAALLRVLKVLIDI